VHFRKKRGNFTEPIYRERKGERVEEMDDAIQKFRPHSFIKKTFISRHPRSPNIHDDMTQIIPNLYVSSLPTSRNRALLKKNKIRTIVCVLNDTTPAFPEEYRYVLVPVRDLPTVDIVSEAQKALDVITESLSKGEPCLVHCHCGVSRSVSVVCLFLMRRNGISFSEALTYVKERRCQADPNKGFRAQLEKLEYTKGK